MTNIDHQCPDDNTQADFDDCADLVIHGPTWTRRMDLDDHARTVVIPNLRGWIIRRNPLGWLEAITPWRPEVLQ